MTQNIPVYSTNIPGGGPQQPCTDFTSSTPVYSTYTGELVGYGPIAKGTICDAPVGHFKYGQPYHVIELTPTNNAYMAHDPYVFPY